MKQKTNYMKAKLIIAVTALSLASVIGYFVTKKVTETTPVNKSINVEVYKTASYISPVYANSTATLEVTVIRVKNNKRDIVWQHAFQPTELKNFPESDRPITQKISIPNVNDKKETLEVYYKVTYNSAGSILNSLNYTTIGKGQQSGKLNIQI